MLSESLNIQQPEATAILPLIQYKRNQDVTNQKT